MTSPAPPAKAVSVLSKRLQTLSSLCGDVYAAHAPTASSSAVQGEAAAAPKKKEPDHRERARVQHAVQEELSQIHCLLSGPSPVSPESVSAEQLKELFRLLPSLAAINELPTQHTPLLQIVDRLLRWQEQSDAAPRLPSAALEGVLHPLTVLLHHPEPWAAGVAQASLATRATAAGLLARLVRFFVSHAEESAVEAQWRQWQSTASDALLSSVRTWIEEVVAAAAQPRSEGAAPHKRHSLSKASTLSGLTPQSAASVLCTVVDLVGTLAGHPCARTLSSEAWVPLLASLVDLIGPPQEAPLHLDLSYTALHVLLRVRETAVVSPGVWRQLGLQVVAKSVPHDTAGAPLPIPISSLSSPDANYASLFLGYVRLAKALLFVTVEESATDSNTTRDTAAQLHAVIAGLIELSASVWIEEGASGNSNAKAPTTAGRASLLAAVVRELLNVREESRTAPRQYARYVQGMLGGSSPLVPCMLIELTADCQKQLGALAVAGGANVLATNVEVLQGVFLWSIHAVIDEGLLDSTRRSAVAAALPWRLYEATDTALSQLHIRLAQLLLTDQTLCAKRGVPLLASRVIACEGLALLLGFLLFVVLVHGVADEVSWNVAFRDRLYAAESRVMRSVGAFDYGAPQVVRDLADAMERVSSLLGPTAAKVGALLPSSTRPSLASAGCHGALDKLLEVLPIF